MAAFGFLGGEKKEILENGTFEWEYSSLFMQISYLDYYRNNVLLP